MTDEWIKKHLIEEGMTLEEMGKELGVTRERVRQILKVRGYNAKDRRPMADKAYWRRVNPDSIGVDKHFFDVLDTEEKAYWLGYITAKGRVSTVNDYGRKIFEMNSAPQNKDHVERFRHALQIEREMTYYTHEVYQKRYYCLRVPSQHLAERLEQLHVERPKHYMTRVPEELPEHLLHHYFRGHFDGKGFILRFKQNPKRNIFFMYGSDLLLYDFCVYVTEKLGVELSPLVVKEPKDQHLHMLFKIQAQPKIQKIMEALYKDATIYMERNLESYTAPIRQE